jgi:mannonate dehydratase
MKITAARVIVCSPGRNFVTLKIETDQGLTGVGDATLNGRELSVVSYLEEHVIPCLIGRDPQQIEDIWQYLYKGAYWRRGPVTMTAIAAVDTALWDIKAKIAGQPLYQLLGGRSRTAIMSYAHATGRDTAETVDEVLRHKEMGYLAIRAQSGIPGLNKVYGVSGNGRMYEPADGPLPGEHDWSTEKYLKPHARLVSSSARSRWARHSFAARCPPSPYTHRSRPIGQSVRALSFILARRPHARRKPRSLQTHQAAHHHTFGSGRDF